MISWHSGRITSIRVSSPELGGNQIEEIIIVGEYLIVVQHLVTVSVSVMDHSHRFCLVSIVAGNKPLVQLFNVQHTVLVFVQIGGKLRLLVL